MSQHSSPNGSFGARLNTCHFMRSTVASSAAVMPTSAGGGLIETIGDEELSLPTSETSWSADNERRLCAPFAYLDTLPGKDFRPLLIAAFNSVLKVPDSDLRAISTAIQRLHTTSLLFDDIEDSATLRRGHPVAHAVYGVPQTINCATYVLLSVFAQISDTLGVELVPVCNDELLKLHRGQGLELYWRDNGICPTIEEYKEMVLNKTGGLFRLAVRLMQGRSESDVDLVPFANILGIIYQAQDDYLNLKSDTYSDKKGFCEDISEGKFSLPIIHSIRSSAGDTELLEIVKSHTNDDDLKMRALECIERTDSFTWTSNLVRQYTKQADAIIAEIRSKGHETSGLEQLLRRFVKICN